MSSVLTEIGNFEKEITLLDGILQNILLFDPKENTLAVNFRFSCSQDYDSQIIGGLTASINEFVGIVEGLNLRILELEYLKLLFTTYHGVLTVFAVDPSYRIEQYETAMKLFCNLIDTLTVEGLDEYTVKDNIAIASQTLVTLLSEELTLEMKLGESVEIYPFKLMEIADQRATDLIGAGQADVLMADASAVVGQPISDEDIAEIGLSIDQLDSNQDPVSRNEAIYHLLSKFAHTFSDCLQITLLRFLDDGDVDKITAGRLETEIEENMYDAVLGMIDIVVSFLDKTEVERTIDLEDKWVLFQIISPTSFMYLVINNLDILDLIKPLIERISDTIAKLYPEK